MFQFAVFTDDISQDLDHALDVCAELGVEWVEIRGAWGKNLLFHEQAELERVASAIHKRGLRVPSISAPVFKSHLPGFAGAEAGHMFNSQAADAPEQQKELIRRAARLARMFATGRVRCFSFWRLGEDPSPYWEALRAQYQWAVEVAAAEGITLVMENDFECNLGSGALAAQMIAEVNSPHLRLLWDCGNAFFVGETAYPDGYEAGKHVIGHVHIKDGVIDAESGKPRWVALGAGEVDIRGQLRALQTDGYADVITLENHYTPPGGVPEDGVRASFANLQALVKELA